MSEFSQNMSALKVASSEHSLIKIIYSENRERHDTSPNVKLDFILFIHRIGLNFCINNNGK